MLLSHLHLFLSFIHLHPRLLFLKEVIHDQIPGNAYMLLFSFTCVVTKSGFTEAGGRGNPRSGPSVPAPAAMSRCTGRMWSYHTQRAVAAAQQPHLLVLACPFSDSFKDRSGTLIRVWSSKESHAQSSHLRELSVFLQRCPGCYRGNVINHSADPFQWENMSSPTFGKAYHCCVAPWYKIVHNIRIIIFIFAGNHFIYKVKDT